MNYYISDMHLGLTLENVRTAGGLESSMAKGDAESDAGEKREADEKKKKKDRREVRYGLWVIAGIVLMGAWGILQEPKPSGWRNVHVIGAGDDIQRVIWNGTKWRSEVFPTSKFGVAIVDNENGDRLYLIDCQRCEALRVKDFSRLASDNSREMLVLHVSAECSPERFPSFDDFLMALLVAWKGKA